MFLWAGLKVIGRLFKRIFSNKHVREYAKEWVPLVGQIVELLMFDKTVPGATKVQQVISIIENKAVLQGKKAIGELTRFLAELRVAHIYNDDIDALLQEGLDIAKGIVSRFIVEVGVDGVSFDTAKAELKTALISAGKIELANVERHLNLLISAALAEYVA